MHWGANWTSGWFLGMHLAWWLFWIILAVAAWTIASRSTTRPSERTRSPLEVLQLRYAQGELTTEEYEERRAKLSERGAISSGASR
jgi:putative membrane protein